MDTENNVVQDFMGITGLPQDQAQMFLEMAGNNLELAVGLFYEQGGAMGQQEEIPQNNNNNNNQSQELTAETILWPQKDKIPEAWAIQGIEFDEQSYLGLGLKQHQNGPCGPLSVINSVLIRNLIDSRKENFEKQNQVSKQELIQTLSKIIQLVKQENKKYVMCLGEIVDFKANIQQNELENIEQVQQFLDQNLETYQKPGGLVLYIYSIIYTKGCDLIRQEVMQSGGELPLIVPPFNICVTDLLMLMLTGVANGNVGDFDPLSLQKLNVQNRLGVGLLSSIVHQMKVPIHENLLNPTLEGQNGHVFILHGGEHFTTLFTLQNDLSQSEKILFYQWNGLKPGGPRMCTFNLLQKPSSDNVVTKNDEPKVYREKNQQYKPVIGEFDSVIQANSEDKKKYPDEYKKWNYECAIIVHDDKDCKYPERPENMGKPTLYEQGPLPGQDQPWRCLKCYYKRFETMCFGQNEANSTVCQHCNTKIEYCGWSIYMPYDQLPGGAKSSLRRQHGPKISGILDTKFKQFDLEFLDNPQQPTI